MSDFIYDFDVNDFVFRIARTRIAPRPYFGLAR
jgi:hypothetical protein